MNYLWIIICQFIVGSSYPIAQEAVDNVPEFILACVTLGIASIILLTIATKKEKTNWRTFGKSNWLKVGFQSLCACVLYTVFLFFALSHASATVSGIFNGLAPALVFVLSPFIVKEKLNWKKSLAILFAVIAVLTVSVSTSGSAGGTDIIGIIFLMLSVISVSLFTVFSKKFAVDLPPFTAAAGVCFTGFIITIPFCIIQSVLSDFSYTSFFQGKIAAQTIYYAVFVWALAYVLWYIAIPKVAATFGGVGQAIVPIASMISSVVFFHESIRTVDIIGLALITLSVVVSVLAENADTNDNETSIHLEDNVAS